MFRVGLIVLGLCAATCSGQLEFEQVPLPDGRIVGGSAASIEEFPHQISMRYYGRHRCGGSIYSSNIIVSASHCVVGVDVTQMTIVAGATYLSDPNIEIPVSKIIMHPKYSTFNNDYDVAILILKGFLPFGRGIQPIPLAKTRPVEDTPVVVSGWGTEVEGASTLPNQLQKVEVLVVDNKECRKSYSILLLTSRMMCAGVPSGGKDACQGDSGGPLIYNNELLGIVSWGVGCARASYPGVYASVPDLYDWIVETAESNTISFA